MFGGIIVFSVISLAFVPPHFYQSVVDIGSDDKSVAGRFVTQVAAVTNQLKHEKKWGVSVQEDEMNATSFLVQPDRGVLQGDAYRCWHPGGR